MTLHYQPFRILVPSSSSHVVKDSQLNITNNKKIENGHTILHTLSEQINTLLQLVLEWNKSANNTFDLKY